MIEYLKGELTELTPAMAVVEAAGVGYALGITLNTFSSIQGKERVKLYVYESIREDAYSLYGFADRHERELFALLLSVSGVGANTARMVLSSLSPSELCDCVTTGNERLLKGVKGIGLKTAQRIIVDLRDKIPALGMGDTALSSGMKDTATADNTVRDEAVGALTMLGFAAAPSQKAVADILREHPSAPVEEVVKMALKQIK